MQESATLGRSVIDEDPNREYAEQKERTHRLRPTVQRGSDEDLQHQHRGEHQIDHRRGEDRLEDGRHLCGCS